MSKVATGVNSVGLRMSFFLSKLKEAENDEEGSQAENGEGGSQT